MAELVSYWKCACPPVVEIRCGGLSEEQKLWWKKLYFNGLGEFFYRNGITPGFDSFMTINAPEPSELPARTNVLSGFMVPIGGGKDSVVTLELLRKAGVDISAYIINPRGATLGCAEAAGIPESRVIGSEAHHRQTAPGAEQNGLSQRTHAVFRCGGRSPRSFAPAFTG